MLENESILRRIERILHTRIILIAKMRIVLASGNFPQILKFYKKSIILRRFLPKFLQILHHPFLHLYRNHLPKFEPV